jgi:ribose transport system ATP-binding protein
VTAADARQRDLSSRRPILQMEGIAKSFPGVKAIQNGRFDLYAAEVHALMGENGAGKSTLIKILSGAHRPDAGTIAIDGKPAHIHSPADSQRAGVAVIYQEFNLVPTLTARENIFLGQEKTRGGFIRSWNEHDRALELFRRMNVSIDPEARVSELSVAQQQVVEIAKALSLEARAAGGREAVRDHP